MNGELIPIKRKNKYKDFLIVIIFLVILFTVFIVSYSFAKYVIKVNGKVFGDIAKPIIELKGEESLIITTIAPKTSYAFEVRNYNENEDINEIEMQYYIEIVSNIDEVIKFELYNNEEKIKLENRKTQLINIAKEKKQIDQYRLDIIYDNKSLEKDIKDNIEIKIHSIQKI